MRARIYQKAKTAMQSGRAGIDDWVLEYPRLDRALPDRLMGWQSSGDTMKTIHLSFPSADEAMTWAEENGIDYTVYRPANRRIKRRAYADNFDFRRRQAWTH